MKMNWRPPISFICCENSLPEGSRSRMVVSSTSATDGVSASAAAELQVFQDNRGGGLIVARFLSGSENDVTVARDDLPVFGQLDRVAGQRVQVECFEIPGSADSGRTTGLDLPARRLPGFERGRTSPARGASASDHSYHHPRLFAPRATPAVRRQRDYRRRVGNRSFASDDTGIIWGKELHRLLVQLIAPPQFRP